MNWPLRTHRVSGLFGMPSVFIKTYGCQMNERDSEAVAAQLVAKGGGRVVESVFFIELGFLDGRAKMGDVPVRALVKY